MAFSSWEERELAHSVSLFFTSTWRNYRSREKSGSGKDIRTLRDTCRVNAGAEGQGRSDWDATVGGKFEREVFRYPQPCSSATWGCCLKMGTELSSSLDLAVPRGNVRVQKLWLGWGAHRTEVSCEGSNSLPQFSCGVRARGFSRLENDAEDLSGGTAANRSDWERLLDTLTATQSHHFFCLNSSGGI